MHRETVIGLGFLAIAGFFVWFGSQLPMGTAARMGPGYVPVAAGALLGLFGVTILVQGRLRNSRERMPAVNWRGLGFVTAGIVVFGVTLPVIGLLLASALLVLIGCMADRDVRLLPSLGLAAVLAAGAGLIFVGGLGMHLPLLPAL